MALSARDRRQLELALGCTRAELPVQLRRHEAAAREKLLAIILGQKVFTRGQDMREFRLFLIIQHVHGR